MKFINALPLSGKEMKQLFRSHVGTDVHSTDGTKDAVLLAASAVVEVLSKKNKRYSLVFPKLGLKSFATFSIVLKRNFCYFATL